MAGRASRSSAFPSSASTSSASAAAFPSSASASELPRPDSSRATARDDPRFSAVPPCPMLYAVLPAASDPLPPLPSAHPRASSPTSNARNPHGAAGLGGAAKGGRGAHARAKSWDVGAGAVGGNEGGVAAFAGGVAVPRLVPVMLTSLSLTVECLMTTATVSVQGTWELGEYARGRGEGGERERGGEGGGEGEEQQRCCDCLFVLPMTHRGYVTAVEVTLADGRFLATAVVPAHEAEAACRASQERAAAAHSAAQPPPPKPARSSFLRLSSAGFSRSGSSRHRWRSQGGVGDGDGGVGANREGEWVEGRGKNGSVSASMEGGVGAGEGGGGEGVESERRRWGGEEEEEEVEVEGSGGMRCVSRRHAAVLLDDSDVHTPHMLRLTIPKVPEGSSVRVHATYVEAMVGRHGYSEVRVPLTVPVACVAGDMAVQDVVRVSCTINSGLQRPMKIGDFNHPMKVVFVDMGRATFVGHPSDEDPHAWPNADFTTSFQVVTEDVFAAVLVQAPLIGDPDTRASFALSIAPPDPAHFSVFSRAVVFILDSETGLRGKPMEEARKAVAAALKRLQPHDSLAVVAFDYELLLLADELEAATPEAVRRACKFVLQAHDWDQPTSVLTPLQLAFSMLRGHTAALQQIVIITDGPVRAERRVCRFVQDALADWGPNAPRIFTFGIGPSVNLYFLTWLAAVTRGSSQVTRNPGSVRRRLDRMLQAVAQPLVTNIAIRDLPPGCELYPYPIPDLYAAAPVVVTGKMGDDAGEGGGGVPLHVELRGVLASGAPWKFRAALSDAGNLPLCSVGAREQVDILTAEAWLHGNKQLAHEVTAMSVSASVVSEHTRMLLVDTTRPLLDQIHCDCLQSQLKPIHHYIHSPTAPVTMVPGLTAGFGGTAARPAPAKPNGEARGQQQRRHSRMNSCVSVGEWEDEDEDEGERRHNRLLVPPSSLSQAILGSVLSCYRPKFK
ncbi:hypothetical protein CLOP_g14774 [Closterium sp. NIES-67]|nr:hypothetical protein CLOP_g14774 [Closterium sp. NIES-67]